VHLRALCIAALALSLGSFAACDKKGDDKKTDDKKADDKKVDDKKVDAKADEKADAGNAEGKSDEKAEGANAEGKSDEKADDGGNAEGKSDEKADPDEKKADDDKKADDEKKADDSKKAADDKKEDTKKDKPKEKPDEAKSDPPPSGGADGKDIFGKKCKSCHGPTGDAKTKIGQENDIEDWTQAGWKGKWPESKIVDIVTNGKSGTKMKPFKDKLTEDEIKAVAKYARSLGK
jgi:mono/diheme cytochrome c family protein